MSTCERVNLVPGFLWVCFVLSWMEMEFCISKFYATVKFYPVLIPENSFTIASVLGVDRIIEIR